MDNTILQAGIDFSQKRADFCLLHSDGQVVDKHRPFANSRLGYAQARQYLLENLSQGGYQGLRLAGEATAYYWLPFFIQLQQDPLLAPYHPQLYVLNPQQVYWFKKSFGPQDKSDQGDPYFIGEHLRFRPYQHPWTFQAKWFALRSLTRYRFHLSQQLTRTKNYLAAHRVLLYSAYGPVHPFGDLFGAVSRQLLQDPELLAELLTLPLEECCQRLQELCGGRLKDPLENARRLHAVAEQSFPAEPAWGAAIQQVLNNSFEQVSFYEQQIHTVERQIAEWIKPGDYPEVACLDSIPGLGPVLAAGIAAEVGEIDRFAQGQKWDRRRKCYRPKNLRQVEDAVAKYAGIWWPRNASGDFAAEECPLSRKGNRYLRYYLVEAANMLRLHEPSYRDYYQRKYAEASKHAYKRAIVLTARKSLGLIVGLLHRRETYRSEEAA